MKTIIPTSLRPFLPGLAFAAVAASAPLRAEISNPGFESLTSGWFANGGAGNFTAPTAFVGFYQTINPVEGFHFGLISNDGVASQTVSKTFSIPAASPGGSVFLLFNYRFLTDEFNNPAFNDTAKASLTPAGGSPLTLVSVSRNDLQAAGAGPLLAGAAYIGTQTIGQSVWNVSSTDVTAYAGKVVTLSFAVDNGGDAAFLLDSRLAIDNVRLSSTADVSRPTISVAGKRTIRTAASKIVIKGTARDALGEIARVEVKAGKAGFSPAIGTTSWKFTAKLKLGENKIQIRSVDVAGNLSDVVTITVVRHP